MITQSYKYFCKRKVQHVALFSSNLASQRETIRQNAKAPEAGQACFEGNQTEMPKRTALFFQAITIQ